MKQSNSQPCNWLYCSTLVWTQALDASTDAELFWKLLTWMESCLTGTVYNMSLLKELNLTANYWYGIVILASQFEGLHVFQNQYQEFEQLHKKCELKLKEEPEQQS